MKKKLVLFGVGKIAEVVHYYATQECGFDVAAFCVDDAYKAMDFFLDKPVVEFSKVEKAYPPSNFDMFVAVGYHNLNELRKEKCIQSIEKGYTLTSVISPMCNLPNNVTTGYNCFIMPPAIIHPCVKIGNNVFVWSGALIGHHSEIGENCWLTSNCNIGGNVQVGEYTFLAMGATVSNSIAVGNRCFLGANVLLTKKIEDEQVVIAESSKPIRLNSKQFLQMSSFSTL